MKAYKTLSVVIIIVVTIPLMLIGIHIYEDYKEFKSCRSLIDYKRYIRKQRSIYPNIFLKKALEIYSVKKEEMIKMAQIELSDCTTIAEYNEFINKYEPYYDNESEIQNLINEAFYKLRPLESKSIGDDLWYVDTSDWLRRVRKFSEKHPSAKKVMDYETN